MVLLWGGTQPGGGLPGMGNPAAGGDRFGGSPAIPSRIRTISGNTLDAMLMLKPDQKQKISAAVRPNVLDNYQPGSAALMRALAPEYGTSTE